VSKMLSVINRIPKAVVEAIGPALAVGRDRWHDLATRFDVSENSTRARDFIAQPQFLEAGPNDRFDLLSAFLAGRGEAKPATATTPVSEWQGHNGSVKADIKAGGSKFTIALKAENGPAFGAYITKNLDRLYQAFQDESKLEAGD